jgi:hypothetical protein
MIAPGIFLAATSCLKNALIRSSRERENSVAGRTLAEAARPLPAAGNASADASTATRHGHRLSDPQ